MTDLLSHIDALEDAVPDPHAGLPEELFLFVTRLTPMVNVDLLIKDEARRTLLTWRDDGYYPPGWHIPGGIIRSRELWDERICAVAEHELGVRVTFDPTPLTVRQIIKKTQRNRPHFISLLFACELVTPLDPARAALAGEPRRGQWAWHATCPDNLIVVHEMYRQFF